MFERLFARRKYKRKPSDRWRLPPWLSLASAAGVLAALAGWVWLKEAEGGAATFTFAATACVFFACLLASRRPLFSATFTAAAVISIVKIALLKRAADGMVLHAWDFVQVLLSWPDLARALGQHGGQWLFGALAAGFAAMLLYVIGRYERTSLGRAYSLALLALSGASVSFTASGLPERGHTQYFWDGLYISAFYRSFGETGEAVWRGGLFERGASAGKPLAADAACALSGKPPHILLIHEESVTPPSVFPGLKYDPGLDPFFRSDDGELHHLRVETYGGASWLTQFSVLAGLSSHAFGSMSNFVQPFMSGRLTETVTQVLAKCGYANMMFTAWPKVFMGVARFYESIGFSEIFDQKAQGNRRENERDRFFFGNALREMERHLAVAPQPLFVFIETMSAHWPYDVTYEPGVDVPGGAPGVHPEVHEYLRRLAMVKMDDDWLRAELGNRFPREAFLIVRYGDHHPLATRTLIGLPEQIEVQDIHLPPDSLAFTTFYAVNGVGYAPPSPPEFPILDAAWLGAILLDAARLPLPSSWRARLELMQSCHGLYWSCADRQGILEFQRRLSDAGLVQSR